MEKCGVCLVRISNFGLDRCNIYNLVLASRCLEYELASGTCIQKSWDHDCSLGNHALEGHFVEDSRGLDLEDDLYQVIHEASWGLFILNNIPMLDLQHLNSHRCEYIERHSNMYSGDGCALG